MRFNCLLKSYGLVTEAGDQTVADANIAPALTQQDAAMPSSTVQQPADEDQTAEEKQTSLAEAEKTLINILTDISTVLRDYLVADKAQQPGNAEKINQLSELINTTRKETSTATDAIELLNNFANSFSSIFSEHFKNS